MGEQGRKNTEQKGIVVELSSETVSQNTSILLRGALENWRKGESPCFLGV